MTTHEFMDELQEVSVLFTWRLELDNGLHAERRKWPRLHLRGFIKSGPDAGAAVECMGAVWYAKSGELVSPKAWAQAGDSLGLPPVRAAELLAAANDVTWAGAEGRREPVEYLQALRARLIAAVGLEITTTPPTQTVRD